MSIYFQDEFVTLYNRDCREMSWPSTSVVFTGPPYFEDPAVAGQVMHSLLAEVIICHWYDGVADNGEVRQVGKIEFGTTQPLVAAGLGCALIHREVFEAFLKVPKWRNDSWTWFGRDQYGPVGDTAHLGEDVTFCLRAKELGGRTKVRG